MNKSRLDPDGSREILGYLLDAGSDEVGAWSTRDLSAVLDHQLRATLASESDRLIEHASGPADEARALLESGRYVTFRDVLVTGGGDSALTMVKGFAKSMLVGDVRAPLPAAVAHFLYVAAVLRAHSQGDHAISALDDVSVEREARRCLTLQWLPVEAREILRAGLKS